MSLQGSLKQSSGCRLLLAGIGGDSHSVGLILLRWGLTSAGYDVRFLGTQNSLEEVIAEAHDVSLVMLSCMDGHARHYLRNHGALLLGGETIWYLGGNPSMSRSFSDEKFFHDFGFRRIFMSFVPMHTILETVAMDLGEQQLKVRVSDGRSVNSSALKGRGPRLLGPVVADEKVAWTTMEPERREVVQMWPTGHRARDLEDNAKFLLSHPNLADSEATVLARGCRPLIQPRTGVARTNAQTTLMKQMLSSGADVVSYQIDSLTRTGQYSLVADVLADDPTGESGALNGYPLVNQGVLALRKSISELRAPTQVRHSASDPRLLAEISFAGGAAAFEGGAICYNLPYYKDLPLAESIRRWQYVDRLAGFYAEKFGVTIHREYFGVLTGTLIPHSLALVTGLLETLLAVRQGVRAVSIGFGESGSALQDAAAVEAVFRIVPKYLRELGFGHVQVTVTISQYMGAFPHAHAAARLLLRGSSRAASRAGAQRIITKTFVEATNIPSAEDNSESLRIVVEAMEARVLQIDDNAVRQEVDLIVQEVEAIFASVIGAGGGDLAAGIVSAFQGGLLDVPFSPSIHNAGKVMAARDASGALRFLDTGGLRLPADIVSHHLDLMSERCRLEGLPWSRRHELIERDILKVVAGEFEAWPLDRA